MLLQWKQGRIQKVNETRSDQNPVHKVSLWFSADLRSSLWACSHTIPLWVTATVVKNLSTLRDMPMSTQTSSEHFLSYLFGFSEGLLSLKWKPKLGYACFEYNTVLYPTQRCCRLYCKVELLLRSLRTRDTFVKYNGKAKKRQDLFYA